MGSLMQGVQNAQNRRQSEKSNRMEDETKRYAGSAYMGDPDAMKSLMSVNPQAGIQMQQMLAQRQAQQQQARLATAGKMRGDIEGIMTNIAKFPDAESVRSYAEEQFKDLQARHPEAMQNFSPEQLTYDEQDYTRAKILYGKAKGEKGNNIGQLSPKDFTVESLAKYAQTGNIGDAVRYSPKIQDIAGIPHQVNPLTQKWEPIVDLTDPSITEQAKVLAKIEADNQSEKDFAKSKLKWQENENKILSSISMADSKTEILNNTTDKLKSLLGALSTRYGSFLSKFPATDARTIKGLIQTIKANSAFTTLTDLKAAGGTLGAISEAELGLLSSALGSIDQSGDTTELIRVLDQISKANDDSVTRIKSGYDREKSRYSTGFQSDEEPKQSAPQQAPADTGILDQARAAIAGGADRQAVINRLKENGIDAGGL